MKSNRLIITLLAMVAIVLSACSSPSPNSGSSSSSNKPKDVSQEFWDDAIQITLYINKRVNENIGGNWGLINGLGASSEGFSEGERKINSDLYNYAIAADDYFLSSKSEESYYETYSILVELFGSTTLIETELDDIGMEYIIAKYKGVKISENEAIENVDRATKRREDENLAWAKSRNPTIGMTKEQVEVSLWGKPQKVNRTVTQYSITEQWVYPNYKYLYFTDGILTSFQD